MNKRKSKINRNTTETKISVDLNIDGSGLGEINTQIGFLNHMLELFVKNGLFDLKIKATSDIFVDEHHSVEDIGIVLGQAFGKALGNKKGINRYGFYILPMDEALCTTVLDLSGRYTFNFKCLFFREKVGNLSTELVYDFWEAFAQNARINLSIKVENGRNDHHKIESIFKSVGRAIREACELDKRAPNQLPSTKGKL